MSFAFCCFAYFYFYYVLLKQCCQLVLRWWYCFKITKQKRFRKTHFTYLVIKFSLSLSFFFYGICHRLTDVNRNIFFFCFKIFELYFYTYCLYGQLIKKSNKSCLDTYEPNDENSIFYEEKINFSLIKMNCTVHCYIDSVS